MNIKTKPTRTLHLIINVVLLFCCGVTPGAKHMAQQTENHPSKDKIALSLKTESSVLRKEEPYFITVTIKNLSSEEVPLPDRLTLKLEMAGQTEEQKKKVGPNFWSPIFLTADVLPDSDIKKRGTLLEGEQISIPLELSQLKWGQSLLSGYPSRGGFAAIPGGQYDLLVECEITEGSKSKKVRSSVLSIVFRNL
jgi:hypothetical protein